jgi:hypothetical protein
MPDAYGPNTPLDFRRPRQAGDVLSDSLAFVREHFVDLGRGLLYIAGPIILLAGIGSAFLQRQSLGVNPLFNPNADPTAILSMFGPGYFFTVLLTFVATVLVAAVGFGYVFLYVEGAPRPIMVPELWDRTKRLLVPVVLTWLGLWLLAIGSMLIFIIPCLGALAWLGGWLYLLPAASLVLPARLIDEGDFFSAFRRGRHLVDGYWSQTFGVVVLVGVVIAVLATVVSLPVLIVSAVIGFNGAAEAGPLMRGVLTVGSVLGAFAYFTYVLFPIAFTMQYFNLVTKQEGASVPELEDRIEAIGRDDDAGWGDADWDEGRDADRRP